AMCVLRGNLAPRGAVIKQSAATRELMTHEGRAVVFETIEDMTLRIDDPVLDVNADDVLVLRNAGPKGAPGMPEAGYLPIPKKLGRTGVKDMVPNAVPLMRASEIRSEEHTSELQSRRDLVCRLLLEKKKQKIT